jgi:ribosome biogenesis GTPase
VSASDHGATPLPIFPACADLGLNREILATLPDGCLPARVIAVHRGACTVLGDGPPRLVTVSGRLRHDAQGTAELPAVGDWVALDHAGGVVIVAIAERRGVIARTDSKTGARQTLAANVDVAFVVTSANRELNPRRIERFVALAAAGGAKPVILLNKTDLATDSDDATATIRSVVGSEVPILPISARSGDGLAAVWAMLGARRTAVLLGSSGVGKSTLTNALLGTARQATASIRAIDDRGRHTTVHRELFTLPNGGLLIDTPGLKLPQMTAESGTAACDELAELEAQCRFSDCQHGSEPGCAVQAAVAEGRLDPDRLEAARVLRREAEWAESRSATRRGRSGDRTTRRSRDPEIPSSD